MSRRSENIYTGGTLILGLATSGTGMWVMTGGAKYIAPGAIAVLCGIFLTFLAFAGRRRDEAEG